MGAAAQPVRKLRTPEQPKPPRRIKSRRLFEPELVRAALKQSFVMLRPDIQWKNPVMFVVEIGTVLTLLFIIQAAFSTSASQVPITYLIALDFWLLLTVLFANFATALAEARGKAQADSLRKTRSETPAFRLTKGDAVEEVLFHRRCRPVTASWLRRARSFPATARSSKESRRSMNRPSPANRRRSFAKPAAIVPASPAAHACSPIASSSASPPAPAESFLDRMIALVEGAIRQRTPNEIALSLVLSGLHADLPDRRRPLWPMALNAELYMKTIWALRAREEPGHRRSDAGCTAGLPDSDHHRRIACRHRHRRHGSRAAGQHPRQERQGGRSRPATSIRCCWTRPAPSPSAIARLRNFVPVGRIFAAQTGAAWPRSPRSPIRHPKVKASSICMASGGGSRQSATSSALSRRRSLSPFTRANPDERQSTCLTADASARVRRMR